MNFNQVLDVYDSVLVLFSLVLTHPKRYQFRHRLLHLPNKRLLRIDISRRPRTFHRPVFYVGDLLAHTLQRVEVVPLGMFLVERGDYFVDVGYLVRSPLRYPLSIFTTPHPPIQFLHITLQLPLQLLNNNLYRDHSILLNKIHLRSRPFLPHAKMSLCRRLNTHKSFMVIIAAEIILTRESGIMGFTFFFAFLEFGEDGGADFGAEFYCWQGFLDKLGTGTRTCNNSHFRNSVYRWFQTLYHRVCFIRGEGPTESGFQQKSGQVVEGLGDVGSSCGSDTRLFRAGHFGDLELGYLFTSESFSQL